MSKFLVNLPQQDTYVVRYLLTILYRIDFYSDLSCTTRYLLSWQAVPYRVDLHPDLCHVQLDTQSWQAVPYRVDLHPDLCHAQLDTYWADRMCHIESTCTLTYVMYS